MTNPENSVDEPVPGPSAIVAEFLDGERVDALALRDALAAAEARDYLVDLLRRNNFNLSKAAREAKIDRKHIRNLLKRHGIPTKDE